MPGGRPISRRSTAWAISLSRIKTTLSRRAGALPIGTDRFLRAGADLTCASGLLAVALDIGAQARRLPQVDMDDIAGLVAGIPMDKHSDAAIEARRHTHLVRAEQGCVHPAKLASRDGGEFGVQIR